VTNRESPMPNRRPALASFSIRARTIVITPEIIHTAIGSKNDVGLEVVWQGIRQDMPVPEVLTLTRDVKAGNRIIKLPPTKPSLRSRSLAMGAFKS